MMGGVYWWANLFLQVSGSIEFKEFDKKLEKSQNGCGGCGGLVEKPGVAPLKKEKNNFGTSRPAGLLKIQIKSLGNCSLQLPSNPFSPLPSTKLSDLKGFVR